MIRLFVALITISFGAAIIGCGGSSSSKTSTSTPATAASPATAAATSKPAVSGTSTGVVGSSATQTGAFALTSTAFADKATIPVQYSCSGASTSPPLAWSGAPAATKAFALILDDPDAPVAGGFVHWVAYDIPADANKLAAAIPAGPMIAGGGTQGNNGAGQPGYTGPCPPAGAPHHYNFRLYALDAPLRADAGKSRDDVLAAIQGHILAQVQLTGLFAR